jgi:hypothetical protein
VLEPRYIPVPGNTIGVWRVPDHGPDEGHQKICKKRLLNGRVKWGKSERDRNKNSEGGRGPRRRRLPVSLLDAGSFVGEKTSKKLKTTPESTEPAPGDDVDRKGP